MANTSKKGVGINLTTGIITIALTLLGAVLYFMSHTTNYYIFGQMNSATITGLLICALLSEVAALVFVKKFPDALWAKCLTFLVTALLAAAAILIVGDRVEGIGNCIVTDYDSGHGGEEAIYMSLIGAVCLLAAMIYNIIGSFAKDGNAPAGTVKKFSHIISASVIGLAAIVATVMLTGAGLSGGSGSKGAVTGTADGIAGTYKVSFNQGNENLENIPDYQFLSSSMAGLAKADARFYIDITLNLDGKGSYSLLSDGYVLEAGKRAEIGDPSGLGLVYTTKAEGSYVTNEDGTVTTSSAEHAVFEVKTDTYSAQMKQMMHIDLNGGDEDGVYDSADCPAVLDYVPETIWTLSGSAIETYESAEVEEEEPEETPAPEAAPAAETASVEISSDDGATKMVFSSDGTYCFLFESYNIQDAGTYTYTDGVLTLTDANNKQTTADGDPMHLQYAYSQSDQLTGAFTIPAADLAFEAPAEVPAAAEPVSVEFPSNDGATRMVFSSDGAYSFFFDSYNIEDAGTYTFADGILTLTDANGKETKAEGDPLEFTYAYSQSDQLTGAFTIPAADLTFETDAESAEAEAAAPTEVSTVEIPSNDGATRMVFSSDGAYSFFFDSYNIEDAGTYTFADGVLTLTDANGKETKAEGDPLEFTYAYSQSDQLTGAFTVPAADLGFGASEAEPAEEPVEEPAEAPADNGENTEELKTVEIPSDDGATRMVFSSDGTYAFFFDSYNIEDVGAYTFADGVLTLIDENGKETKAEGDPLHLHYAYSKSDQLTGDFTITASDLAFTDEIRSVEILSDDEATRMVFSSDGAYSFFFDSYNIEDAGTYTFADGVLTLTDANGKETKAEGDPLEFTYAYSKSDQLTGKFSVSASDLSFPDEQAGAAEILSDDGATRMVFSSDGAYSFFFDSYNIEDAGTYTFADGILTLTDANGKETKAEGTPIHLTYAYSKSDQLVGQFTIDPAIFK